MDLATVLSESVLPRVQKPSRYLGTELNSVFKDPRQVELRACLAFPDSYDLGLGNLGLQILYHLLNREPDIWAERVCAPHPDLEAQLRARGLPLFSLESKTPLAAFDLLGFTLQWELNYTNILNMLDLGGVPVLAEERRDEHPIVAAGGPCVFNPEPLALFVDVFVVGDGEEAVLDLARAVQEGGGRDAVLDRLAAIPGCYVPSRYPMVEGPFGQLVPDPSAPPVVKRLVRDLDSTPFPTDYLVPFTEQVHDRVSLEVLRGCTQGCRFCQAGMVTRPVRERSLETLAELQAETMRKTGYEEISLVSLSTCDYSKVKSLVSQSAQLARPEHVSVSLPSLRLDSFSIDLAHMISDLRKSGLTFAPEAATDRMRAVINKFIPTDDLLEMARQCYGYGWDVIKLYFMIGLPTETDEDVEAIGELTREVLRVGQRIRGRTRVNLGVSTFVPKPHTPFQWAEQIPPEETERRQRLLYRHFKGIKAIKFGRHDAGGTYLEGLLTRGDRRVGWLLYHAWREGARFDGWSEHLDHGAWERATARWEAEFGRSARDELRERDVDEPLPWDHIDVLIPKGWQRADWDRARSMDWAKDCRQVKCNKCGVIDEETQACVTMLRRSRQGAKAEADLPFEPPPTWEEPPAVARLRFRWARTGLVRLLSHRELMNGLIRAMRRAGVPIKYSEGFHPHAALSFSAALPVGYETEGDWADVTLCEPMDAQDFTARLNAALPPGFAILEALPVALNAPALMAQVDAVRYRAHVPREFFTAALGGSPAAVVASYLEQPAIIAQRRGKVQGQAVWRPLDIRPMIAELAVTDETPETVVLEMLLVSLGEVTGKVENVLTTLLGRPPEELVEVRVRKLGSYARVDGQLLEPQEWERERVL